MLYSQLDALAAHPRADSDSPTARVVATLQGLLPAGSAVALAWEDAVLATGCCASPGARDLLQTAARQMLEDGAPASGLPGLLSKTWTHADSGTRVALVAEIAGAMTDAQRQAWLGTARALVATVLVSMRQQLRIQELERSKRLQKALFEIADLAGSDLDFDEMLAHFHQILGSLMYAENCYIVECDEQQSSLRFLYFVDTQDDFRPEPERSYRHEEMPASLTFAVLRHGQVMSGPSRELLKNLDSHWDQAEGLESVDWLGVPMWRNGRVCGAIVVQSYQLEVRYSDEDRAVLNFVAKHILTAMDRRQAHVRLEQHVQRRTLELERANVSLQAEINERRRAESVQAALFRISELAMSCNSQADFHAQLHAVICTLLDARNFYIALVNATGDGVDFVYSVDEKKPRQLSRRFSGGLTEYTIRKGQPLLAMREDIDRLIANGEVCEFGTRSHCWLGVPLLNDDEIMGVIAVQSYTPDIVFNAQDQRLLAFVAGNIGNSLTRQRDRGRLLDAHAELERRVVERTHELGEVNQKLLGQIGERLRAEERLTYLASHDVLTGLPNRMHLQETLEQTIAHARLGIGTGFALLFLDLDRFKWVNDSIGHAAGDQMLVEVARRLVQMIRADDVVARLGGDEFALVVRCDSGTAAMELGRRLLKILEAPMWVEDRELFPSGSVGIALWHPRYTSGADLLRDADAAMYRAKVKGQDRCVVFDAAMHQEAMRSLELESDLRRAINNRGFVPFYQPIVSLADGRLIGHEALLRWPHEQRGLLLPGQFLELGEESGLIEKVDWLIYEQVARDLARSAHGYVSVNVSPRHFRSADFAPRLLAVIADAGADAGRLRIEITETALLDDAPRTLHTLEQLRDRGVVVQLDDFGTGYSALSYLHRFPITALKIDRSFVAGLHAEGGKNTLALVDGVLSLARTLGIETIGEGVETEQQRQTLQQLGCNYGQGYLLGYPAPRELTLQQR